MFIIIVISLFVGIVTVPLYYSLWQMTSNDDWQVIWINTGKFYIFLIFNTTGRCFIWNDTVISFIPVCLLHFTFSKNSNSNLKLRSIVVGNFKTLTWIINNLHLFCYKFLWFTCNIKYLQLFQIVSRSIDAVGRTKTRLTVLPFEQRQPSHTKCLIPSSCLHA